MLIKHLLTLHAFGNTIELLQIICQTLLPKGNLQRQEEVGGSTPTHPPPSPRQAVPGCQAGPPAQGLCQLETKHL
jgi:hypothetical protein